MNEIILLTIIVFQLILLLYFVSLYGKVRIMYSRINDMELNMHLIKNALERIEYKNIREKHDVR